MKTETTVNVPEIRRANKAQLAQFFDVTLPTVEKWVRDGMPVVQRGAKGISWVIDLNHAAEWRYSPRLADGTIDPESLTPAERKLWYDGETRRRELQVRDRELIPSDDIERSISTAYSAIAQSILALPDLLERKAGLTPEQARMCELSIHETMNDLADTLSELSPVGDPT